MVLKNFVAGTVLVSIRAKRNAITFILITEVIAKLTVNQRILK